MNRFGLFLMPAILLALATAVHGQAPPPPPLAQPDMGCPAASWYFQAFQDSAAALQRLRVMCAAGQAASCQPASCCEAKAAAGATKDCGAGQAPKTCCCAKGCACCETCKTKKNAAAVCEWNPFAQVRVMPQPVPCAPAVGIAVQSWPTMSTPALNCMPPQCGNSVVQIVPVRGDVAGYNRAGTMDNAVMRVVQFVQPVHTMPVHLATPDLDARCDRIQNRGDLIILEGNVLLLVKKHAQPIRIEAQRVLVNMRDGSFSVESEARPVTTTSFGVMRTTFPEMPNVRYQIRNTVMPPPMQPGTVPVPSSPYAPPLRDDSIPR